MGSSIPLIAIYIGPSIYHASNVGLGLSLSTGLVSPTFHAFYDDRFETVNNITNQYVPKSYWQVKCGFQKERSTIHMENQPLTLYKSQSVPPLEPTVDETITWNPNESNEQNNDINESTETMHNMYNDTAPEGDQSVHDNNKHQQYVTRSGRIVKRPDKYGDFVSYQVNQHASSYEPVIEYIDPISYTPTSDPDTMYFHEILRQKEKQEFLEAMQLEISNHTQKQHWVLMRRKAIHHKHRILPCVWSMRRKRNLITGKIVKWEPSLNVDGSKQQVGIDYIETYAPVASWISVRMILILAVVQKWTTMQLDFIQAFPQAPAEQKLYIDIPKGCTIANKNNKDYALKVLKNIYGQKQAGKVWNDFLITGLTTKLGFTQSIVDPCMLWRKSVILIIYTDDTIIAPVQIREILIPQLRILQQYLKLRVSPTSPTFGGLILIDMMTTL
jgi:Reverse transcriptase (RNA-dependent DNA polymerase)